MVSTFLLAFGFGNLAMLGWLAAVAAPVLIHLWSRHRYREAPWAAMQFLLAAMRKNARRLQLQQWLLLAVRILIIALVVLAAAEPYGERLLASLSGEPAHKILVIDGSYSMAYRGDRETRFEQAKRIAAQLVEGSQSADTFTVLLMAAPAETVVGRNVVDHAAVIAQIDSLGQRHTGADLAGTLTLVEDAIKRGAGAHGATIRHQVYFLTDLQRTTWGHPERPDTRQSSPNDRIASLSKQAELAVIDLGDAQATNTAVTSLVTSEPVVTVGRDVAFDATLRQFGQAARPQCAVELLVDGMPVSEQSIDLVAGTDATARFTHRFQSSGQHLIEVRTPGDRLDIDNSRWAIVPVREEIRVLCVAGRPGAAKYIADALSPSPAGNSPIRPIIISDGDLAAAELMSFDGVFLCNVARLTPGDAERLMRYAQAGGGLVFFLGDRADRENYNSLTSGNEPLLPATLGEILDQHSAGIDPLDYRHPIVAPFRSRERAGLLTTPITRYHQLVLPTDRLNVEVAAAMKNGDPLIVTAPLGHGRTVLVATDGSLSSTDPESGEPWTNWPTWPSFLPIVRELLAYATGGRQQAWQQLVGTPLTTRGIPTPDEMAGFVGNPPMLKLEPPGGGATTLTPQLTPAGPEWTYADTFISGIYKLRGFPNDKSLHFAINVDTRESDLTQVDPHRLPAELRSLDAGRNAEQVGDSVISRAGWNQSLLWATLALVFIESFLAWQFGRGTL